MAIWCNGNICLVSHTSGNSRLIKVSFGTNKSILQNWHISDKVIDIGKRYVLFKGQLRPVEMHAIDIQELWYAQEDDATGFMFIQFRFLYVQAFLATVRRADQIPALGIIRLITIAY